MVKKSLVGVTKKSLRGDGFDSIDAISVLKGYELLRSALMDVFNNSEVSSEDGDDRQRALHLRENLEAKLNPFLKVLIPREIFFRWDGLAHELALAHHLGAIGELSALMRGKIVRYNF